MLLRLLLPGLILVHYSKSVVIRSEVDSTEPPASDTTSGACTCVPFFLCRASDFFGPENGGQCASSDQVCCKELFTDTNTERCSTPGTSFGYCVEFKDCIEEMMPHINTVPFPDFVSRFGCGRASLGANVRVCCSTRTR
ncbi:uncharacterized protein [Macrobrachium rosenbergii]|uniref:uncharacterized protein n=1 Tax=Macrobrachium rosenbergii TaxID=79674 RepID=UPI0034D4A573